MPISPQGVTFRTISVKQAVILFIYLFMITCSISRIMYWFKGSAKNGENKKKNNIILKRYMSSLKVNVISILPVVCTLCRLHLYTLMIRGAAISAVLTCSSPDSSSTKVYFPFSEPNSAALCDAWLQIHICKAITPVHTYSLNLLCISELILFRFRTAFSALSSRKFPPYCMQFLLSPHTYL